jgi:putative addiction module component (TIGR02574 family)
MTTTDKLLAAALDLPTKERARIAHELIVSLDDEEGEPDPGWEEAWRIEIERRLQAVRDGTAKIEDGPTVVRAIEAELRAMSRPKRAPQRKPRRTRRAK